MNKTRIQFIYKFLLPLIGFFYGFKLLLHSTDLLRYSFLLSLALIVLTHVYLKKIRLSLIFTAHGFFFLLFVFFNLFSLKINGYNFHHILRNANFWFHEFLWIYFLSLFFQLSTNSLPAFFMGLLSGIYVSGLVSILQYVTYYESPLLKYVTKHHLLSFDFIGFGFQPTEYELISKSIPRVTGFFLNPNVYVYSLGLALMVPLVFLFLKKSIRQKILVSLIFFIGVLCLGMTYSRGGWVCFGCGVFVFLWMVRKKLILPVIVSSLFVGFVLFFIEPGFKERIKSFSDPGYTSNKQRVELVTNAWATFIKSPLWGIGLYKNKQVIFHKDYNLGYKKEVTHSHNMYLELLVGLGLFGFLSLMAFFFTILNMILKSRCFHENPVLKGGFFAVLVIFLTGGLFCTVLAINETRSLFFSLLSVLFFMSEKQKETLG